VGAHVGPVEVKVNIRENANYYSGTKTKLHYGEVCLQKNFDSFSTNEVETFEATLVSNLIKMAMQELLSVSNLP